MVDLSVKIKNYKFKNPVMTGSGTYGYGDEFEELYDPSLLGAVLSKGLTMRERGGNPPPRIHETPAGILNSIGLANMGIDRFVNDKCFNLAKKNIDVIANISGKSIDEFGKMAEKCNKTDAIKAVEVNVSCPNVKEGGMAFGVDTENIYKITSLVKNTTDKPVIVKLSPNVTDITEMAQAAVEGKADALTLINTLLGMAIDIKKEKPVMYNKVAGLSGPAIKPVGLRMVYQVKEKFPDIKIIGSGGISCWQDAVEYFMAGASAVQIGTALFNDPMLPVNIIEDLRNYLMKKNVEKIDEIIGIAIKKEECK
ncbi:MAG: dihydroorotate dehydrogenase [Candidatus Mcinerneyibacterium aminivorans]|uniref:Dihydroorotate dehydrogenase n=1 Tax=Candidatus Mcinerneyibacterium aminivorans TaxID=2703815 RepID=A0A5D0MF48_9BACT|nr:MAG: dihydroorotate dehydrogenase [Candidatus Mcinerneyibacterium aminivorans]